MIMIISLVTIMSSLRYRFPLDHKKLAFMVMIMITFTIGMSPVGTKPLKISSAFNRAVAGLPSYITRRVPKSNRTSQTLFVHRSGTAHAAYLCV